MKDCLKELIRSKASLVADLRKRFHVDDSLDISEQDEGHS